MESDVVQVSVQVPPEHLEKAKRYNIDLSEATQYGIDQLAQSQNNTIDRNIWLSSMWLGFPIGCIPAVLLWLLFRPAGNWLLAVFLVQIAGMLGSFVVIGRRKFRRYYAEHPEFAPKT
jgi:hypothetical protein